MKLSAIGISYLVKIQCNYKIKVFCYTILKLFGIALAKISVFDVLKNFPLYKKRQMT